MKVDYGYLNRQYDEIEIDHIWQQYVKPVVMRGDFTLGDEVREFEFEFAKFIGSRYCIGVANGTDALWLALKVLGVGPGDEVIVPVNTFIASAAAIAVLGATPVYVDVNDKFVMDVDKVESKLTDKTKAFLPVHFAGQPVSMQKLKILSNKHGIPIVEDAAQAANASFGGVGCGCWGDIGCISFHPQKNMNAWGDAGAIVTSNKEVYEKLLLMRNHGMSSRDTYEMFAYNSRLDTIQAAVLLHDLKKFSKMNDKRIKIAHKYDMKFKLVPQIRVPNRDAGERHTFHLYMIEVADRDRLYKHLKYLGIDCRIHYPIPLHLQTCSKYLGYREGAFPMAELYGKSMISLPIHPYMTDKEIEYVIEAVVSYYK